jgi:hypothetical protein
MTAVLFSCVVGFSVGAWFGIAVTLYALWKRGVWK